MQKITQVFGVAAIGSAFALLAGCSSAQPPAVSSTARPAASVPGTAAPSLSVSAQPVVASRAQSAVAGAAAVMNILHRGGKPSAETCAAQWNELPPEKQASLDHDGFDAGCFGASQPDVVSFGPGAGPSPTGTPGQP
ncbi:hypothetical protein OG689_04035 [Kitasatospora sp. NBC_00240]|uniref:hypothetical protein n=1 Tax=Kitasatospora sp. NBC_00240 TaxID=2903567 RepID=UPI00225A0A09|nr:hypothetical protein [Kitasatospora sp. NBC_00240]MCX5208472.1 hypothetical protein [Kitasatospora sp. NBC_00240]